MIAVEAAPRSGCRDAAVHRIPRAAYSVLSAGRTCSSMILAVDQRFSSLVFLPVVTTMRSRAGITTMNWSPAPRAKIAEIDSPSNSRSVDHHA